MILLERRDFPLGGWLVTGGTRGMGAAVAGLLAARGARVVVTARRQERGDRATPFVPADLASPDGAGLAASQATRILGGLDIVVHCAGASFAKPGGALAWLHRHARGGGQDRADDGPRRDQPRRRRGGAARRHRRGAPGAPRHLGTSAEVARLVAFLVSDAASYISGAEYVIDGGNNRVL